MIGRRGIIIQTFLADRREGKVIPRLDPTFVPRSKLGRVLPFAAAGGLGPSGHGLPASGQQSDRGVRGGHPAGPRPDASGVVGGLRFFIIPTPQPLTCETPVLPGSSSTAGCSLLDPANSLPHPFEKRPHTWAPHLKNGPTPFHTPVQRDGAQVPPGRGHHEQRHALPAVRGVKGCEGV